MISSEGDRIAAKISTVNMKARRKIVVKNPLSLETIETIYETSAEELNTAIKLANSRLNEWINTNTDEKEKIFYRASLILEEQKNRLASLIVEESGSTLQKSEHEIQYSANILRAAAGEIRRLYGETIPDDHNERFSLVVKEPMGIVGAICPFNAPLALLVKMIAFPLAAGNMVIAKPSLETPLIALEFAKIFTAAGLPQGVFQVVCGDAKIGEQLVASAETHAITFTGSTHVGKKIAQLCGLHIKPVHLELGGNNPLLVFDDFDLEKATDLAIFGSFFHAGQICMASSRILVQKTCYQKFRELFVDKAKSLHLGSLFDPKTLYGPLINQHSKDSVLQNLQASTRSPKNILAGGKFLEPLRLEATIVENVALNTPLWQEETFGPVATIMPFSNTTEGIKLANASKYGLSAGILTNQYQIGRAHV